jgi:hypothetical protein
MESGKEEGKGNSEDHSNNSGHAADEQAVSQTPQIVWVVEECFVAFKRQYPGIGTDKTCLENIEDRVDDGEKQDREYENQDKVPG